MPSQHEYEEAEADRERRELRQETRQRHDTWVTFWCEYKMTADYCVKRLIAGISHEHAARRFVLKAIETNDINPTDRDSWVVYVEGEPYTVTLEMKAEPSETGQAEGSVGSQQVAEENSGVSSAAEAS